MKENVVLYSKFSACTLLCCRTYNTEHYDSISLILLLQLVDTSWRVSYSTIICPYMGQTCLHAQGHWEMSNLNGVEGTPSTHVPLHIGHTITKYVVEEAGGVKSMGDHS